MPRKRMLNPMIWEDPAFNSLSRHARLLFIGMISNADDDGYIRGDVGSLKRLIFGFDSIDISEVEKWVEELKKFSNIHFFESNNEWYAHFIKWESHQKQRLDRRIQSEYPKCTLCAKQNVGQVTDSLSTTCLSKVKESKVKESKVKRKGSFKNDPSLRKVFAKDIIDYFISSYEEKFGSKPAISFGKDHINVGKIYGLLDTEQAKNLIDVFLVSEKARENGYTLSVCFSVHTVNQWKAGQLRKYVSNKVS